MHDVRGHVPAAGRRRNLAAVGSEGGVSLIWDPSPGTDVAGYLILRGEIGAAGPPATLAPLTPQPIRESTYRDDTARRGARYVYAVVAHRRRDTAQSQRRIEPGRRRRPVTNRGSAESDTP